MKSKIYIASIFLILVGSSANGQVVINEYSASNLDGFSDNYGKSEDWIELHNTSGSPVNIGGMYLSDHPRSKPTKWMIPTGTMIGANSQMVFWCSGRDEASGSDFHTNFKLTQTSGTDSIGLISSGSVILEEYALGITHVEHSWCRTTDGGATWKICTTPTAGTSNNGSTQYDRYAAQPAVNIDGGFFSGGQTIIFTNPEPSSSMYYTLDGTMPTASSTLYTVPISITANKVVKARIFSSNPAILPGKVESNTYFINENISLAVLSIGADDVIDLANGSGSLIPIGSIEYFDKNGVRVAESYGSLNRHGQDSWILPQRSIDWVSRDEMGYSKAVDAKLFNYSDRTEYQRFMMRASGDDNYPANNDPDHVGSTHIRDEYVHQLAMQGMKLDRRAVERVVVFLNGQYWGVYGLRERPVDHDYTDYYYNQGKYDLQYLTTWGSTQAEYGGTKAFTDWENLRDFILNNDMSVAANYQVAKDSIQLVGLIDYMIANLNSVASDWLNYNTGWWRGLKNKGDHKKWGYIIWDNDATFDYYINYSGVPNTDPDADPCDIEDIGAYMDVFFGGTPDVGKHEKIFLKLQNENEEFRQLYYSRQADLMNTIYTCDNMLATLDSMKATIEPEMQRHINRWTTPVGPTIGSWTEWQTNFADLRDFIEQRCQYLEQGMLNCYPVTGPYDIMITVVPMNEGDVEFNTLSLNDGDFPWTGRYFGGMDNIIKADPDGMLSFIRWETTGGSVITPSRDSANAVIRFTEGDTLIAVFGDVTAVEQIGNGFRFTAYPTMVTDVIYLDFELDNAREIDLRLYSAAGVPVADFTELRGTTGPGKHRRQINIQSRNLAPGMYLLDFRADDSSEVTKIFVR